MEEESQDKEEDQEEIDEDETDLALVPGSLTLIGALSQLQDDEDASGGPISMDSDDSSNSDAEDEDEDYSKEHPFESVDISDLSPLPEENDQKYPKRRCEVLSNEKLCPKG